MTIAQIRSQWQSFVVAFDDLGSERLGMSPEGASVLAQACVEFETDHSKGFRPLKTGTPPMCARSIVDILTEYASCRHFWAIDENWLRAQVTQDACQYVLKHQAVFSLLNSLI